jgi:hypothetical protein
MQETIDYQAFPVVSITTEDRSEVLNHQYDVFINMTYKNDSDPAGYSDRSIEMISCAELTNPKF